MLKQLLLHNACDMIHIVQATSHVYIPLCWCMWWHGNDMTRLSYPWYNTPHWNSCKWTTENSFVITDLSFLARMGLHIQFIYRKSCSCGHAAWYGVEKKCKQRHMSCASGIDWSLKGHNHRQFWQLTYTVSLLNNLKIFTRQCYIVRFMKRGLHLI